METYTVTISFDDATLKQLQDNGWILQQFMGAQGNSGVEPVVWNTLNEFASNVSLTWQPSYGAFFCRVIPEQGEIVQLTANVPIINLGQELVLSSEGDVKIQNGTNPDAIGFVNQETVEWGCGLTATPVGGVSPQPICVFNSFHTDEVFIMPFQTLVINFVTNPVVVGTVVMESISQAIGIVMSPSTQQTTNISFDINTGWDFGANTNCTIYPPNTKLAPVLYPPKSTQALKRSKGHSQAVHH